MNKLDIMQYAPEIMARLEKGGLFLNSKLGDEINTMTIGWGSLSIYWIKPIFIAPVRLSRHTHHMIAESGVFTVSVPLDGKLRKELGICGTKSGRDENKFELCNFTAVDGKDIDCPQIAEAWINIECKVIARTLMDGKTMDSDIIDEWYDGDSENGNYHELFFGEVLGVYVNN